MKKFLVVTIDVEPDCRPNWQYSDPLTFNGVSVGIQQRLHPLFLKYDIKPTYLINNVVLEDLASVEVLSKLEGRFEIGSHLHPEFIEPEKEHYDYAGKRGLKNGCLYPPGIEAAKIENYTKLFKKNFGFSPTSFRAGRFSAGDNTIKTLASLGYKVDTSVTPHVVWRDPGQDDRVDFSKAPEQPYFMKDNKILSQGSKGSGGLLQVPVSIVERKASVLKEIRRTKFGLRGKMKSTTPVWLRPVYATSQQHKSIVDEYLDKYSNNDVVVLNTMFHNVEVLPKMSPYTQTEADCEAYLGQLEWLFKYCKEKKVESAGLTDLYDQFR